VALFVNADAAQVAQVIGRVHPAMLQFHGEETPEFCAQFGLPYVKACRVAPGVDLLEYLRPFSRRRAAGCSTRTSRSTAASARASTGRWFRSGWRPLVLSGGLSPDNVGAAVRGSGRGPSTSPAASSRRRESRTPRAWRRSSRRSGMRMHDLPDARGHFGRYGGVFVAETLTHALEELLAAYARRGATRPSPRSSAMI
jgi:hypothetical protein